MPILPTAADLADHPGLVPWLTSRQWIDEFEQPALKLAAGLIVESIKIGAEPGFDADEPTDDSDLLIEARGQGSGSKPHLLRVLEEKQGGYSESRESDNEERVKNNENGATCNEGRGADNEKRRFYNESEASGNEVAEKTMKWLALAISDGFPTSTMGFLH